MAVGIVRSFARWIGTGLIAAGVLVTGGTLALYGYSQYEQAQIAQQAAAMTPVVPIVSVPTAEPPTPMPTAVAAAGPVQPSPASRSAPPTPPATALAANPAPTPTTPATALPTAVPTATRPVIYPVDRIWAPSIGLDSKVAESPIVGGEWVVPKFEVGHLQGTAQPLSGGNIVLAGHVESITSGDVFANLGNLKPGARIRLYTPVAMVPYVVQRVEYVANDNMTVIRPTGRETLTLITCSGNWLPLQHDYSQRLVVVAVRAT